MSLKINIFNKKWITITFIFLIIALLFVSVNNGNFIRGEESGEESKEQEKKEEVDKTEDINIDIAPIEEITKSNTSPQPGNSGSNFSFKDNENNTHQLSDFQEEKVVILNFWASWCPPCKKEMPLFQNVYENYKNEVQVLGINIQENKNTIKNFMENNEYTFPVLQDNGKLSQQYHVQSIPTTIFIDKKGVITERYIGLITMDELESKLEKAINAN